MEDSSSVDNFECQCKDEFRSACKGLPYYADAEGNRYCVLHYPRDVKEKSDTQFQEALDRKFEARNFDFAGVYFPSTPDYFGDPNYIEGFKFKEYISFRGATFRKEADFRHATFLKRTWPRIG